MSEDSEITARCICSIARAALESRCAGLSESLALEVAAVAVDPLIPASVRAEALAILDESRQ